VIEEITSGNRYQEYRNLVENLKSDRMVLIYLKKIIRYSPHC
jgi:hypothetical protein